MQYRPLYFSLNPRNTAKILQLINLVVQGHWEEPDLTGLLTKHADARRLSEVALLNNKVVGVALAYADEFAIRGKPVKCIFLRRLCVDEPLQRTGIGARLLRHIAERIGAAADYGPLYPIAWVTAQTNPKSIGFYTKAGFTLAETTVAPAGHRDNIYIATPLEIQLEIKARMGGMVRDLTAASAGID